VRDNQRGTRLSAVRSGLIVCLLVLIASPCRAEPELAPAEETLPPVLSLDTALGWALQHNPDLAALRQQHGIAAAGIVIARTYPYNPTLYNRVTYVTGPEAAGITMRVPDQGGLFFQVELCHQGRYRLDAAEATLTRTDWEIAFQELTLAVRVVRAFYAVLYRQEKVCLVEETIRLNQRVLEQIRRLVEQGRLRGADLIVAQTDVDAIRALLSTARSALTLAQAELYRSLGVTCATVNVAGALELPPCATDCQALVEKALHGRADLRGRQVAVDEAEARLRLQLADRYGNPTVGPFFEQDPTNISFVGVQMNIPLPLFNTKCGEIQLREAEKQRAFLDVQRTEVLIQQDVEAAVARLASACAGVQVYRAEVLPNLRTAVDNVQKLLQRGDPGVDALKVADLERKLLRARDGYLDALFEMSQAHADLVAAVGDPLLAVAPCPTPSSQPATHLP